MSFVDRYRSANLSRNPFSIEAINEAGAFLDRGVPTPPPPRSRALVQVVGGSGFGKSTHIERWRQQRDAPLHYIPVAPYTSRRATPPDPVDGLVYGDEIDRMPTWLRWRWFRQLARHNATVVIGSHADHSRMATLAGFASVTTTVLNPLNIGETRQLIEQRLDAVALGPTRDDWFAHEDLRRIHAETNGVPRAVLRACHGHLAAQIAGDYLKIG